MFLACFDLALGVVDIYLAATDTTLSHGMSVLFAAGGGALLTFGFHRLIREYL